LTSNPLIVICAMADGDVRHLTDDRAIDGGEIRIERQGNPKTYEYNALLRSQFQAMNDDTVECFTKGQLLDGLDRADNENYYDSLQLIDEMMVPEDINLYTFGVDVWEMSSEEKSLWLMRICEIMFKEDVAFGPDYIAGYGQWDRNKEHDSDTLSELATLCEDAGMIPYWGRH